MLNPKSYRATSVTLVDHTKFYNLATLLLAVDATFSLTGREVNLQVDKAVIGTVRIGDDSVSAAICGYALDSGDSRLYRSDKSDIPLGMFYLGGSVDNLVVNVEVCQ